MHALSKKHYYDVLKCGQEDTILESELSKVDCDREETLSSDVGCYARPHLKSHAVQTHLSRNDKNFRNECTITSDVDSGARTLDPLDSPFHRVHRALHCSRSYEDIAFIHKHGYQTTVAKDHQNLFLKSKSIAPKFFVERAVECLEIKQRVFPVELKTTEAGNLGEDVCIQCAPIVNISDRYEYLPCNRGLAACRAFSLGSPVSRHFPNEQCCTKLIGGCRVPVCRNHKSKF